MLSLLAHFIEQNDSGGFPFIVRVWTVVGKITNLTRRPDVDREDTDSYIVCTYLARFAGIILGILSSRSARTGRHFSLSPCDEFQAASGPPRDGIFRPKSPARGGHGQTARECLDLRGSSITLNEGNRRNLLQRDTRSRVNQPEPISPRHKNKSIHHSRDVALGDRSHGVACATESVRGLRLSLVPRPGPSVRLLPVM